MGNSLFIIAIGVIVIFAVVIVFLIVKLKSRSSDKPARSITGPNASERDRAAKRIEESIEQSLANHNEQFESLKDGIERILVSKEKQMLYVILPLKHIKI